MATVTIRNLDDGIRERLRIRAAQNGRSMEAEIRAVLAASVSEPAAEDGLLATVLARFGELGGVELDLPARATPVRAADLFS